MSHRDGSDGLERAIKLFDGINGLARAIDRSPATVSAWRQRGIRRGKVLVPSDCCPDIELATNGRVTCEDLNPDVKWWVVRGSTAPAAANEVSMKSVA